MSPNFVHNSVVAEAVDDPVAETVLEVAAEIAHRAGRNSLDPVLP